MSLANEQNTNLSLGLGLPQRPQCVAFLASFPPRQCGIATFTNDVIQAIVKHNPQITPIVIALENNELSGSRVYPASVGFVLPQQQREKYRQAADFINQSGAEVLCVQHEFGLYGGEAGEWLLELLALVRIPIITVLHTVLPDPSPVYLRVTRHLARLSSRMVVMTRTAAQLMQEVYGLKSAQISVIYHGVPDVPFTSAEDSKTELGLGGRTVLATFGLINKGKGIEYVLDALPEVVARYPNVKYLVLGGTHPVVREHEGEVYRQSLEARVQASGLGDHVQFENRYLDFTDLCTYLAATDIYLTPYLGRDQIVSGTLAYALGFGKVVISTPYLYAQEVLANKRGSLVEWKNSKSISTALLRYLDDPELLDETRQAAYRYGHQMAWPNIGRQYAELAAELAQAARSFEYSNFSSTYIPTV